MQPRSTRAWVVVNVICGLALFVTSRGADAYEIFSGGMEVPETISQIPNADGWNGGLQQYPNVHFFDRSYAGDFLVPDPRRAENSNEGKIWRVPQSGGDAESYEEFRGFPFSFSTAGVTFLPWSLPAQVGYRYWDPFGGGRDC